MYFFNIDCSQLNLYDCRFRRTLLVLEHDHNVGLFCDNCYVKANALVINETYRRDAIMLDEDVLSRVGI